MQEIKITLDMIDKARVKAEDMGRLNNSILKGKGSLLDL